jgi:hypothetical protein
MELSKPGYGPMEGACEQENKASDSINGTKFLDESRDYHFRRKNSVSRRWLQSFFERS